MTFDNITLEFKKSFVKWLYTNGVKSQNTVNKIISTIKQFMVEAANETTAIDGELVKYHSNQSHLHKDFGVKRVKTSKVFLELTDLDQIAECDLTTKPSYAIVRDYFLISSYTGLRISDLYTLNSDHISDDKKTITLHTFKGRKTKADNEVVIPILPELTEILERYDYQLPECLSEQKHNDYIKEICKLAKVDRKVLHKESIKGEIKETKIPIWSKVTNHTGRFTFINFMLNDYGVSPLELQKITGQSLSVLMGYERGNKDKNARKVIDKIIPSKSKLRKIS